MMASHRGGLPAVAGGILLVVLAAFAPVAHSAFSNGVEGFIQLKPTDGGDFDGLAVFSYNGTASPPTFEFFVYHGFYETLAATDITLNGVSADIKMTSSEKFFFHGTFANTTGFLTRSSPGAAWTMNGEMAILKAVTVGGASVKYRMAGTTWTPASGVTEMTLVQMYNKATCAGPAAAFLWKSGTPATTNIVWTGGPVSQNFTYGIFISDSGDLNPTTPVGAATWAAADKDAFPKKLWATTTATVSVLAISGLNDATAKKFPGEVQNIEAIPSQWGRTLTLDLIKPKGCTPSNSTSTTAPASTLYVYFRGTQCSAISKTALQDAANALARITGITASDCVQATRKARRSTRGTASGVASSSGARFQLTFPAGAGAAAATQFQRSIQSGSGLAALANALNVDASVISMTALGTSANPTAGVSTGALASVDTTNRLRLIYNPFSNVIKSSLTGAPSGGAQTPASDEQLRAAFCGASGQYDYVRNAPVVPAFTDGLISAYLRHGGAEALTTAFTPLANLAPVAGASVSLGTIDQKTLYIPASCMVAASDSASGKRKLLQLGGSTTGNTFGVQTAVGAMNAVPVYAIVSGGVVRATGTVNGGTNLVELSIGVDNLYGLLKAAMTKTAPAGTSWAAAKTGFYGYISNYGVLPADIAKNKNLCREVVGNVINTPTGNDWYTSPCFVRNPELVLPAGYSAAAVLSAGLVPFLLALATAVYARYF
eukprot:tig00020553_g10769.t1